MTTRGTRGGTVGWIAGSFAERDEALSLLQDDGPAEPLDELGVGAIRDLFSNAFFPGVTTLQTRAKYFVLVPAMYHRIEAEAGLRKDPAKAIKSLEEELLQDLRRSLAASDSLDEAHGVIGSRSWKVPQTPPSAIYWTGIHTWRIRRFADSRTRYHAWLRTPGHLLRHDPMEEDAQGEKARWSTIPNVETMLERPTIALNRSEAEFLESCVLSIPTPDGPSLLRQLLEEPEADSDFWDTPIVNEGRADLTSAARHAELFSHAHHGAMRLYNLLCATQLGHQVAIDEWTAKCDEWWAANPADQWSGWHLEEFWQLIDRQVQAQRATVTKSLKRFVNEWVGSLRAAGALGPRASADAKAVLRQREQQTKPGRERLSWPYALQGWTDTGVGVGALDFRWHRAKRIIRDIQIGLQTDA